MASLVWDKTGERFFEAGVSNGVLYVFDEQQNKYGTGVAWNGLTAVNESPTGADSNELYADNIKYLNLRAAENFEATIEAYTYPDEFKACNGEAELGVGVTIGQQSRKSFCFSYVTKVGNDTVGNDYGEKIHIIYGCTASPSSRDYSTINDSPDAITFSWSIATTPVEVTGHQPTALLVIDSKKTTPAKLQAIKDKLYGTSSTQPEVLTPNEILALLEN